MADPVAALLELWTIDQRRRELSKARDSKSATAGKVEADWKALEAAAQAATTEASRSDALIRQYQADVERCDKTIAEMSQKKLSAKSNKEYMDVHNGIEQAKAEKTQREQSVKELIARKSDREKMAQAAVEKAAAAKAKVEGSQAAVAAEGGPTAEEQELAARADAIKAGIDPEFLKTYEKLVKSGHKSPLMRVDPKTRATPFGTLLSHNMLEQIRQGKLVIDRASNAILYIG